MPRLLLDTHTFLWWIEDSPQLSASSRRAIQDSRNECYLSMASCWEMAIKSALGKLELPGPIESFISEQVAANSFSILNIELRHLARLQKMPFNHRDPFDRLLIAQALTDRLTIVTADAAFAGYNIKVIR